MEDLDRIHIQALDCFLAKVLLDKSKNHLGLSTEKKSQFQALSEFVEQKISPSLKLYTLRRLVDYNLIDEALILANSNSDTLTLLEVIVDTKKRLLLSQDEYLDLNELLEKSAYYDLTRIRLSEKNLMDLDQRCRSLLTQSDTLEGNRVWSAYIEFHLTEVGSAQTLERAITGLVGSTGCIQTAITFYKALEDEHRLSELFSNVFLMRLLEKSLEIKT